ncbi:uncharacterized protein LOC121733323 [Aricia agestis]|uniref:uncharacterized protein LOC121733323 n=1 Tax=Aricia agestis TaxID=91739 RepID=UPI001C207C2C|nr:uncharacterized protein LOC121733323 [Aricia agestis]
MLVNIMTNNFKTNGWINLLFMGDFPDRFYEKIKNIENMTVAHSNLASEDDEYFEDAVPYHSNIILLSCLDFEQFEKLLKKTLSSPYWHPLSNIILYFQFPCDNDLLAKVFFTLWYYKGINTIIIHESNSTHVHISYFSPYISEEYKLDHHYGCSTTRRVGMSIKDYRKDFHCADTCENVTLHSVLRTKNLGTCLGLATHTFSYDDPEVARLDLFPDKVKNLHGFVFKVFMIEVLPFLRIDEMSDGSYELRERDGLIWNTMANLMNFKIDLSGAKEAKKRFSYDYNVQKIFEYTERKADLILFPVYQFDLIIAKLDNTFPFMESGVCFISYRAPMEKFLVDIKMVQKLYTFIIEFVVCFTCVWLVFLLYDVHENRGSRFDQIGRSYLNTVRLVLCISLHKPQKQDGFRIFLAVSIWSFFLVNFAMQAQIISLYSSSKRGKNVDTFEDVIEKGYFIEGIGSPDVMLPDDDERYRKINEKLVSNQDIFECIRNIRNDSRRFCLMDCALGRYLELNLLNEKGEQYLHVARRDRMHSLYLNMLLQLNSPLLDNYNKYMMALVEGGIIRKWMQYRYRVVEEEVSFKTLSLEDLEAIFQIYLLLVLWSFVVLITEVIVVPVYQMDLGVEVDYTFPYVQSGVCFVSHKPETKKELLGSSFVVNNYNIVIEFFFIFFFMWLVFFLHNSEQIGKFSYDQAGRYQQNLSCRLFYWTIFRKE